MSKRILIIEDEPSLIKALSTRLKSDGFEVFESMDGEDGLHKAISKKPDLILLDILLPKMDGVTLLKRLRENEIGKNIPVIVLSNLTDAEKSRELLEERAMDYLIKAEWRIDDLVEKIKKIFGE